MLGDTPDKKQCTQSSDIPLPTNLQTIPPVGFEDFLDGHTLSISGQLLKCTAQNCIRTYFLYLSDVSVAPFLGDLTNGKYFLYAQSSGGIRPTLNIFPSQPMQVEPSTKQWQLEEEEENEEFHLEPSKKETIGFVSTTKRPSEISMELSHPKNDPTKVPQPSRDAKVVGTVKRN